MTTLRFTLKNLEGELLPNTQFKISAGYPDDTYDPDLELPANTLFTTDNNGEALVTLAPLSVPYYLTRATDTLDDMIAFKFFVPNSATVLEADFTYVDLGSHLHTLADNSMYTFIETKVTLANAVEQVTISAIAASEAASAAATSATAASSSATAAQTAAESAATDVAAIASSLDVHTNDATAHSQYHRKDAIANDSDALWCGTAGGTANALTLALPASPVPQVVLAYKAGLRLVFKANAANTGAVTVNFNGMGGKSIVTQGGTALLAGDIEASGVYEIVYDGTHFQIIGFTSPPDIFKRSEGNCILSIIGDSLWLRRYRGLYVPIDGVLHPIPEGGISLLPFLSISGTWYVYVYASGGMLSLEVDTTGYVIDAATGVSVKLGDSSRTLVGMAYKGAISWELCRSWFNDFGFAVSGAFSASRTITSPTAAFTEFDSEIRCKFLCWSFETVCVTGTGGALVDLGSGDDGYGFIAVAFDGTTAQDGASIIGVSEIGTQASNNWAPISPSIATTELSEGYHYATLVGFLTVTAGAGIDLVCRGSATPGTRTALTVFAKR